MANISSATSNSHFGISWWLKKSKKAKHKSKCLLQNTEYYFINIWRLSPVKYCYLYTAGSPELILKHCASIWFTGNIINVSFGATFAWFISNAVDFSTEKTPLIVPPLETSEVAWIGTTQYIGAVVGTVFFSLMGDAFGRKNTLAVLVIPQMVRSAINVLSSRL